MSREASVLERVRDRARNLSSVFPYQRRGEALYLDPDDWKVLADELDRVLARKSRPDPMVERDRVAHAAWDDE